MIDPLSHKTTFAYDALNRLTTIVEGAETGGPNTTVLTLGYTLAGDVSRRADALATPQVILRAYDRAGRELAKKYAGLGTLVAYTYDRDGNITYPTSGTRTLVSLAPRPSVQVGGRKAFRSVQRRVRLRRGSWVTK